MVRTERKINDDDDDDDQRSEQRVNYIINLSCHEQYTSDHIGSHLKCAKEADDRKI